MPSHSDDSGETAELRSQRRLLAYLAVTVVSLALASHYPRLLEQYDTGKGYKSEILATAANNTAPPAGEPTVATPASVEVGASEEIVAASANQSADNIEAPAIASAASDAVDPDTAVPSSDLGLIDSDFSLGGPEPRAQRAPRGTAETIRVRKTVAMGNATIGSLPITIDSESKLSLEATDLRQLLSGQAGFSSRLERIPESGTVSFQRLRDLGIDLRYNPTSDQVTLQRL